jgi:hypothetical protein
VKWKTAGGSLTFLRPSTPVNPPIAGREELTVDQSNRTIISCPACNGQGGESGEGYGVQGWCNCHQCGGSGYVEPDGQHTSEDELWAVVIFNDAAPPPATFLESVEREVAYYRQFPSPVAQFLADQLANIAQLIAWTDAHSPDEYLERLEIAEDEAKARFYDRGWHDGSEATKAELSPYRPE